MTLPENDAAFHGAMFFSVAGCQGSMASAVRGVKAAVHSVAAGPVMSTATTAPARGRAVMTGMRVPIRACTATPTACSARPMMAASAITSPPHGSWEMFPALHGQPLDFHAGVVNGSLRWTAMPGMALALVYFVDVGLAQAGTDNPIAHQAVLQGAPTRFALADAALVSGRDYIAVTVLRNSAAQRVAFASTHFTAP